MWGSRSEGQGEPPSPGAARVERTPVFVADERPASDNNRENSPLDDPFPALKDATMNNSFGSQATLTVGDRHYTIYRLDAVEKQFPQAARLPYALKILLENLLRTENGLSVRPADIEALATWNANRSSDQGDRVYPQRVLLQDFHRRARRR